MTMRRWQSKRHLDNVRQLPCAVTQIDDDSVQAHHIKNIGGFSGAGLKAPDYMAMPLLAEIHSHLHIGTDSNREELVRLQPLMIFDTLTKLIRLAKLSVTPNMGFIFKGRTLDDLRQLDQMVKTNQITLEVF